MLLVGDETCPLPDDPFLAAWALALNEAGQWAEIFDRSWRSVHMTDDARRMYGGRSELAPYPLDAHAYGPERTSIAMDWRGGQFPLEVIRRAFALFGPWVLADTPGGRDELRALVGPRLTDMVDGLSPELLPAAETTVTRGIYTGAGAGVDVPCTVMRVRDDDGAIVGTVAMNKPAVGMAVLTRMTAMGDLRHFERMEHVARPGRRPAAVLFADLESSSPLAKRLSTASYFTSPRAVTCRPRMSSCGSDCTGAPTSTSARSRRAAGRRSPRSATRSTKPPASKHAPPADSHSPQRTSSSDSRPMTPPHSTSTPITSPTARSATWTPRPRRPAETHPPSPSARSDSWPGNGRWLPFP